MAGFGLGGNGGRFQVYVILQERREQSARRPDWGSWVGDPRTKEGEGPRGESERQWSALQTGDSQTWLCVLGDGSQVPCLTFWVRIPERRHSLDLRSPMGGTPCPRQLGPS